MVIDVSEGKIKGKAEILPLVENQSIMNELTLQMTTSCCITKEKSKVKALQMVTSRI